MSPLSFDVVTVGGGLAASALAGALARKGLRVLILEKETQFKDRVRGEYIVTWGVAEAKELGIEGTLLKSCASEIPYVDMGFGPRNLVETTAQRVGGVSFFHPEMQETLLAEAERAGAEVRRGVSVTNIAPGTNPSVVAAEQWPGGANLRALGCRSGRPRIGRQEVGGLFDGNGSAPVLLRGRAARPA